MAKIKHIAMAVPDPEKSARFYETALGMKRAGLTHSPIANGVYLADGYINLALLNYRSEKPAGKMGMSYTGIHHFGFQVDDIDDTRGRIEANGGAFYLDLPVERETLNYEMKFTDPDGQIFDISHAGWIGTESGWPASPAVPKIKHIALSSPDPERIARFYETVFGLKRMGPNSSSLARGFYLSDGQINLAVLRFSSDAVAGPLGKDYAGIHHFGYVVNDLEGTAKRITDYGCTLFRDMPERRESLNYEMKFNDTDGQVFDISHQGWVGTSGAIAHGAAAVREAAPA